MPTPTRTKIRPGSPLDAEREGLIDLVDREIAQPFADLVNDIFGWPRMYERPQGPEESEHSEPDNKNEVKIEDPAATPPQKAEVKPDDRAAKPEPTTKSEPTAKPEPAATAGSEGGSATAAN